MGLDSIAGLILAGFANFLNIEQALDQSLIR